MRKPPPKRSLCRDVERGERVENKCTKQQETNIHGEEKDVTPHACIASRRAQERMDANVLAVPVAVRRKRSTRRNAGVVAKGASPKVLRCSGAFMHAPVQLVLVESAPIKT